MPNKSFEVCSAAAFFSDIIAAFRPNVDQGSNVISNYQSHASEHRDSVDALSEKIDEGGDHNNEIKDVPATLEVLLGQR